MVSKSVCTPAKLKAPISATSSERLKLTLQIQRQENKLLSGKIEELQSALSKSSLPLNDDMHSDFQRIFSDNMDKENVSPFMKLFWKGQQKYLRASKTGVRYHPMIIRYCLNLAAKSPSAYEEIRYDEKQGTGFLVLPSR